MQGVGSAVNKLNDVVAMVAEVTSIAQSLSSLTRNQTLYDEKSLRI